MRTTAPRKTITVRVWDKPVRFRRFRGGYRWRGVLLHQTADYLYPWSISASGIYRSGRDPEDAVRNLRRALCETAQAMGLRVTRLGA